MLAAADVRFVGDPVAMVVAETRYQAEDAVDAIEIDIDPAAPLLDFERSLDPDVPIVHPRTDSNLAARSPENRTRSSTWRSAPPVVITETFRQHRYAAVPMETRGTLVSWNPGASS